MKRILSLLLLLECRATRRRKGCLNEGVRKIGHVKAVAAGVLC